MYIFAGVLFLLFVFMLSEISNIFYNREMNRRIKQEQCDQCNEAEDAEESEEDAEESEEDAEDIEEDADEEDTEEDEEEDTEDEEEDAAVSKHYITAEEVQELIEKNNNDIINSIIHSNDSYIKKNMGVIIEKQNNIQNVINTLMDDFNKYMLSNIQPTMEDQTHTHTQTQSLSQSLSQYVVNDQIPPQDIDHVPEMVLNPDVTMEANDDLHVILQETVPSIRQTEIEVVD
jgi:hypothetical protein